MPYNIDICLTISQLSKISHEMFFLFKYGLTIKARFCNKISLITTERKTA